MKLSLGLSPCPNDTYIFYALLHQSIDTLGITFEPYFADIAELNRMAY
ncbi:MAG: 1,4-dihydroxy-6-naphthoate synthase, partial [Saprospiraceae bacterium]|nr:1,4-dihydroxy-6-naphthoate synthase [Saprospiraceae bacterium]